MSDVTVIGLGAMGSALARAELKAGHSVTVWNRSPDKITLLVDLGASGSTTFSDAIQATSEHRNSLNTLRDIENILANIQNDKEMKQRWEQYCKDNDFAKEISFEAVLQVILKISADLQLD